LDGSIKLVLTRTRACVLGVYDRSRSCSGSLRTGGRYFKPSLVDMEPQQLWQPGRTILSEKFSDASNIGEKFTLRSVMPYEEPQNVG
jgi:hypothetical protein